MRQVKLFNLSIEGVVLRFYLMIAVVAIGVSLGQIALATTLGMALAVSFTLGVSVENTAAGRVAKRKTLKPRGEGQRKAA